MERNTIIAVVISVVIVLGVTTWQVLSSPAANELQTTETETAVVEETTPAVAPPPENAVFSAARAYNTGIPGSFSPAGADGSTDPVIFRNDFYTITFDPRGAQATSIKLNQYEDNGEVFELLFRGENDPGAFLLYAGDDHTNPIDAVFNLEYMDNETVIFAREFEKIGDNGEPSGENFTIRKTFRIGSTEYMIALKVDVENSNQSVAALNYNGYSYTLGIEPQVGPSFTEMRNNNYNYRRLYAMLPDRNSKSQVQLNDGVFSYNEPVKWIELTGKYFATIVIPKTQNQYLTTAIQTTGETPVVQKDSIYLSAPATYGSTSDVYHIYMGPQLRQYLSVFDRPQDNSFGLSDMQLEKAMDGGGALGWLENILKWCLQLFYRLIPNWGVAIILLTVLVRALLYPLSRKSTQSTARMSELQPKLQELQAKYKDNPEKLNQETMKLYKEYNISPMSGCLPLLIQMPIFFALYGLLNKHFELRGAMFIPGWIPDLSVPDTVLTFGFSLPLLGNELHLLPIIYTASMVLSMKITQRTQTSAQKGGMQWFMTWGMPLIFFFILYDAPSGLLLYWTVTNFISILQQQFANKKRKKERDIEVEAEIAAAPKEPSVLPPKAKKKK